MIILYWLKSPSSASKISSIERLLPRISKQMRAISAQPKSNQTYSVFPKGVVVMSHNTIKSNEVTTLDALFRERVARTPELAAYREYDQETDQ